MDGEYGKYKPRDLYEAHGLVQARCGLCGAFINENYAFCPKCGVEIDWEDEDEEEDRSSHRCWRSIPTKDWRG